MDENTLQFLMKLNQDFYDGYAQSFSSTRYRIQPGIGLLFPDLLNSHRILDLGCGNGTLAKALLEADFQGTYVGVDNSRGLLSEAKKLIDECNRDNYTFIQSDLASSWSHLFIPSSFDMVVSFAVIHHFPLEQTQGSFFQDVKCLLETDGFFCLSTWQIKNNPRLKNRIQPWSLLGLNPDLLTEDDLLVDWRADPTQPPRYRYVCHYDQISLKQLGEKAGFELEKEYFSDGKEGNLALYQVWKKALP